MVTIERVDCNTIVHNTNNYPLDALPHSEEIRMDQYHNEIEKTHLKHYYKDMNAMYPRHPWIPIELSPSIIKTLLLFNNTCSKTGRLSLPPSEDDYRALWDCAAAIEERVTLFKRSGSWFFRFSSSSPKDGLPDFPVLSGVDVAKKIVTSMRASFALIESGNTTLYFRSFREDYDMMNELRVFIYKKKITAISSYYSGCSTFSKWSEEQLTTLAAEITDFWSKMTFLDKLPPSYTMDLHIGDCIELLEFNSFGYWLAAGSSLFDWVEDYATLYGNGDNVVFRVNIP